MRPTKLQENHPLEEPISSVQATEFLPRAAELEGHLDNYVFIEAAKREGYGGKPR